MRSLDSDSIDHYMTILAQVVAVGLTNNSFKAFIEQKVKSEQGGIASFLLLQNLDSLVGEQKLYQFLADKSQLTDSSRDTTFFSNDLIALIPNISISVFPGENITDINNWSFLTSPAIPVMPVTEIYNDTVETQNIAYYSNLTTTYLSNQTDPAGPVLIVQADPFFKPVYLNTLEPISDYSLYSIILDLCEELKQQIENEIALLGTIEPFLTGGFFIPRLNPQFTIVLINVANLIQQYEEECGEDDGGGPGDDDDCDRDTRECREMITYFTVKNKSVINQFCPWALFGRRCLIEVHTSFITLDEHEHPILSNPPLRFIEIDRDALREPILAPVMRDNYRWRYLEGIHGDIYAYNLIGKHPNPGKERTFSLGLGIKLVEFLSKGELTVNTTFQLKRTTRDYNLGGEIIEYCDDANYPGQLYDNGLVSFRVIEIENCN